MLNKIIKYKSVKTFSILISTICIISIFKDIIHFKSFYYSISKIWYIIIYSIPAFMFFFILELIIKRNEK